MRLHFFNSAVIANSKMDYCNSSCRFCNGVIDIFDRAYKGNDSVLYLFRPHRFNMVSYSPQSRRLAVGAKNGQLALYDLRSSRCQVKKIGYKLT